MRCLRVQWRQRTDHFRTVLDLFVSLSNLIHQIQYPPPTGCRASALQLADSAEFARIGRYYATESMLVWDEQRRVRVAALASPAWFDWFCGASSARCAHGM